MMMGEEDRLGGLQVGEAGHDHIDVGLGLDQQGIDQQVQVGADLDDLVPQVEADVQRHLVIAGTAGVQPLARLADGGRQARLDVHVDVFQADGEIELAGLDLPQDPLQAMDDLSPRPPAG